MHSALRIRSANASPASAGHGRCDPQLAVALVASIFGGVTGLVVDLAAQAPRPPSNVRILGDGVVAPPPATPGAGTQPSITCAAGSISISPGASIQAAVNLNPGNTTFCLRAGTHFLRSSITPKTGNTFVGEYGAILDGTGWTTSDAHAGRVPGAQPGHRLRDHPQSRHPQHAAAWHPCLLLDVRSLDDRIQRDCLQHECGHRVSPRLPDPEQLHPPQQPMRGYLGRVVHAHNTTFESNEIAYNGREQKVAAVRERDVPQQFRPSQRRRGIWYDSNNTGALIEGNRVEDNGRDGIFYEISSDAIIRNNTVRRNAGDGGDDLRVQERADLQQHARSTISGASPTSSTAPRWRPDQL